MSPEGPMTIWIQVHREIVQVSLVRPQTQVYG